MSAWISHCSQTNVESRGRKGVGDCRGGRDRVRRKMGFETWGGVSTEQLPNGPTMTRTCVIMQTLWRIDGGKWSLLSSMCFCAHPPARFKTSLCTLSAWSLNSICDSADPWGFMASRKWLKSKSTHTAGRIITNKCLLLSRNYIKPFKWLKQPPHIGSFTHIMYTD